MDQYNKAISLSRQTQQERETKRCELLKNDVVTKIKSNIMTLGIGSLAEIEETFGHLWGHGKPVSRLSALEKEWRDIWNQLRTVILDNVNKRIRIIEKGLDNINMSVKTIIYKGVKRNETQRND